MKEIITNWQPQNESTTPLVGIPQYVNTGIIKVVMKSGEKISIAQIDYQEFNEQNFQYVIEPYWEIIDGLPASIFQGIPGINMELRLNKYYRVNYIPTFITERTPSKNREDLWELLESVDLDYYDRFEWLLRTNLRSANDNLIVERKRPSKIMNNSFDLSDMQYGDKIIIGSLEEIAKTKTEFNDVIFTVVTSGVDIVNHENQTIIDSIARISLVPIVITQKLIAQKEYNENRIKGINKAKSEGKYVGRKPIDVDLTVLQQVKQELDDGIISIKEAMRRTKISSKTTFYRKLREFKNLNIKIDIQKEL